MKGPRILTVDKLTSRELYSYLISTIKVKPSNTYFENCMYFENLFKDNNIDWKAIYILPQKTIYNTYLLSFQYKILNILF